MSSDKPPLKVKELEFLISELGLQVSFDTSLTDLLLPPIFDLMKQIKQDHTFFKIVPCKPVKLNELEIDREWFISMMDILESKLALPHLSRKDITAIHGYLGQGQSVRLLHILNTGEFVSLNMHPLSTLVANAMALTRWTEFDPDTGERHPINKIKRLEIH